MHRLFTEIDSLGFAEWRMGINTQCLITHDGRKLILRPAYSGDIEDEGDYNSNCPETEDKMTSYTGIAAEASFNIRTARKEGIYLWTWLSECPNPIASLDHVFNSMKAFAAGHELREVKSGSMSLRPTNAIGIADFIDATKRFYDRYSEDRAALGIEMKKRVTTDALDSQELIDFILSH